MAPATTDATRDGSTREFYLPGTARGGRIEAWLDRLHARHRLNVRRTE